MKLLRSSLLQYKQNVNILHLNTNLFSKWVKLLQLGWASIDGKNWVFWQNISEATLMYFRSLICHILKVYQEWCGLVKFSERLLAASVQSKLQTDVEMLVNELSTRTRKLLRIHSTLLACWSFGCRQYVMYRIANQAFPAFCLWFRFPVAVAFALRDSRANL